MSRHLRPLLIGALFILPGWAAAADEELVANPYYKFWAGSRPGATAVHVERTKLPGQEGKLTPGGVDEKKIAYKLLSVNDSRVVVEQTVTERDFLGFAQAAPTKYIYPAMLKKSHLERIILSSGGKTGEDSVKVGDKEIKCKTLAGTIKGADGVEVDFKLWLSNDVPGSIVKQVRTTRKNDETIAESTTTLLSSKPGE
jgi:hypothetical protein